MFSMLYQSFANKIWICIRLYNKTIAKSKIYTRNASLMLRLLIWILSSLLFEFLISNNIRVDCFDVRYCLFLRIFLLFILCLIFFCLFDSLFRVLFCVSFGFVWFVLSDLRDFLSRFCRIFFFRMKNSVDLECLFKFSRINIDYRNLRYSN